MNTTDISELFNLNLFVSKIYSGLLILILISGCNRTSGPVAPNVDNMEVQPQFIWTMDDLQTLNKNDFAQLEGIMTQYPVFFELYVRQILGLPGEISREDTTFTHAWNSYISDSTIQLLFYKIDSVYSDQDKIEKAFLQPLKYFKYYFPEQGIPNFYFTNTGLGIANFLFEDQDQNTAVGVGLDFFLGQSFPYALLSMTNPVFSKYMSRNFDEEHLVKQTMSAIVDDIAGMAKGSRMLDLMIHNGKKMYILHSLLPSTPLHVLFGYSEEEMRWCKENKKEIWAYFIDEKLFYETTSKRINTYVRPAPNSKGMPTESPGETANFMGYLIVSKFMQKHPNTDLNKLIQITDYQYILDQSKFKP